MRMKPHIYTVNMKRMLATGQNPTRLAFLELGEANGALGQIFVSQLGESENGERLDHRGIEAARGGGGGGRIRGEENHRGATVTAAAAEMTAASAEEVPAGVAVEEDH